MSAAHVHYVYELKYFGRGKATRTEARKWVEESDSVWVFTCDGLPEFERMMILKRPCMD